MSVVDATKELAGQESVPATWVRNPVNTTMIRHRVDANCRFLDWIDADSDPMLPAFRPATREEN